MFTFWMLPYIGAVYSAPTIDCSYKYLDICANDLLLFRDIGGIVRAPVSIEELRQQCESQAKSENCVRERSEQCTTGIVKGISRLFLDTIRDEMESRCDFTSEEHQKYMEMAPCLDSISGKIANCSIEFIKSTDVSVGISSGLTLKQKIPHACCNFGLYSDCMLGTTKESCGAEAEAFIKNMVDGASGDLIETACSAYKVDSETCRENLKLTKQLEAEGKYNGLYKEIKTFMGAIAKLTDSLTSRN
ncbi:uncharacterized protein LOC100897145 [Galendromus occidentalis]|uniref:Uncharacterized protein LOC100897145 n=1 Tax=Galendromus occidentalis TaxID=34638 RepID=A0AAJ6QQ24_9ACAR|nr:uncharacterized protein LOC100897145 [Galendromus occidentalis]